MNKFNSNNSMEKTAVEIKNDKNPIYGKRYHTKIHRESDFSEDEMLLS